MDANYQLGDTTPYGRIVEKPFGDDTELVPEHVYHFVDTDTLRLNQFVYVNEEEPWRIEAWCTQSPAKGVPGVWNGPRKLRTMKLVDGGVYPEFALLETNIEADNTVGVIGPLVCVLNDGRQFVAVNEHKNRRGAKNGLVEAMRQRHGSLDAKPEAVDGQSMIIKQYKADQLGLTLTNSACIHAETADGLLVLALVRHELVVASHVDHLPNLSSPFVWKPIEDYLFLTLDSGRSVVALAIIAGYIPMPPIVRIETALIKLPAFVAEQTK